MSKTYMKNLNDGRAKIGNFSENLIIIKDVEYE